MWQNKPRSRATESYTEICYVYFCDLLEIAIFRTTPSTCASDCLMTKSWWQFVRIEIRLNLSKVFSPSSINQCVPFYYYSSLQPVGSDLAGYCAIVSSRSKLICQKSLFLEVSGGHLGGFDFMLKIICKGERRAKVWLVDYCRIPTTFPCLQDVMWGTL